MGVDVSAGPRSVHLFSTLPEGSLKRIGEAGRTRWYASDLEVVSKGTTATYFYGILRGRLKVTMPSTTGEAATLSIMGPGEIFGEIALLDGQARSATVTTLEPCELLLIERAAFLQLLRDDPEIAMRLLEELARRIRQLSARVEDAAFLDISARLAKQLVALADRYGQKEPDGSVRVRLKLSQRDLGQLVGATRESVNKLLQSWRRRKILGPDDDGLVLRNLTLLRRIAGSDG